MHVPAPVRSSSPFPWRPALGLALALATRAPAAPGSGPAVPPTPPPPMTENPLLTESNLPYQLPPFDRIKDADFAPDYAQGMAEEMREVDAIARDPSAPTFDNTVVALERSGRQRKRVDRIFSNLNVANTNPVLLALESDLAPKLAAHQDAIRLNRALFARLDSLHGQRDRLGLDAESRRLLERTYKDFVRAGARLAEPDKARLRALNAELASLETAFSQNLLHETNASAVAVTDRAELAGLSPDEIATAAAAAH